MPFSSVATELDRGKSADRGRTILIDTTVALRDVISIIYGLPTHPPALFIDVEGINLGRQGTVSILQIHAWPMDITWLIDVHTLQAASFTTQGERDCGTLQDVLEASHIPKIFFDVRNDSDALFCHYGIKLAGIQDLQLMELAKRDHSIEFVVGLSICIIPDRAHSMEFVIGLSKCIDRDAPLTSSKREVCRQIKKRGRELFAPEIGGSYEVFNQRPLAEAMVLYCAQDVQLLPLLWKCYSGGLSPEWEERVLATSRDRVLESQSPTYNGQGRHKAMAPQGWV